MKRYFFILITFLLTISVTAQVKQEVIASAGGFNVNGNLSISWTLGETIIPTFTNGNLTLTHGFQQQLIITSVEEKLEDVVKVSVYPNPVSDNVTISFSVPLDGEVSVSLLNSQGKLMKTDIMEENIIEKQLNLQDFPPGVYFLRLIKGKLSNVYKVVKL
jgi:hypothetical protein